MIGDRMVHCADAGVPELQRLARTLDSWHDELLAYFDTNGISNGPTESDQSPDQEDQARWARLPQLRQLPAAPAAALRVEWQTPDATPIRGRLPCFIA
jgi:hypothetical protein